MQAQGLSLPSYPPLGSLMSDRSEMCTVHMIYLFPCVHIEQQQHGLADASCVVQNRAEWMHLILYTMSRKHQAWPILTSALSQTPHCLA